MENPNNYGNRAISFTDPKEKNLTYNQYGNYEGHFGVNINTLNEFEKKVVSIDLAYKKLDSAHGKMLAAKFQDKLAGVMKWAGMAGVASVGMFAESADVHPWEVDPSSPAAIAAYVAAAVSIIGFLRKQYTSLAKKQSEEGVLDAKKKTIDTIAEQTQG